MTSYPPPQPDPTLEPPPKPGMGCGTKVLITFGILFVLGLLSCCGVIGYVYYYFSRAVSEDPAKVVATTDQITKIEIPATLRPTMSINFTNPFSGETVARVAVYEGDQDNQGTLSLSGRGQVVDPRIRQAIDQAMRQQGVDQKNQERLENSQESHKELQIRGEKATFTITKGTGSQSKTPRIQVQGTFQGINGPAVLVLDADARKISEDDVNKMLESIR